MRVFIALCALIALCSGAALTPSGLTQQQEKDLALLDKNYDHIHEDVEEKLTVIVDKLVNLDVSNTSIDIDTEVEKIDSKVHEQLERLKAAKDLYELLLPEIEAQYFERVEIQVQRKKSLEEKYIQLLTTFAQKIESIQMRPVDLPTGDGCVSNDDCLDRFICEPMEDHLQSYLDEIGEAEKFNRYRSQLSISGNECVLDLRLILDETDPEELLGRLDELKNKTIGKILEFQDKMTKFNVTIKDMDLITSQALTYFEPSSLAMKPNELYLIERGQAELDIDQLLIMMMPNQDAIKTMMSVAAKGKGADAQRLPKLFYAMDSKKAMKEMKVSGDPSIRTGEDAAEAPAMNPLLLMSLLGGETLDPMMVLAMSGGLDTMDPLTMMMLLGGEDPIDPMMLMLLSGQEVDPVMMMLMQGKDIDPMMLMLMQGKEIDPMMMMLMQGKEIDPMMMMLMQGKEIDPMMMMLMQGGDIDPLTLMLMQGKDIDPMMLMLLAGKKDDAEADAAEEEAAEGDDADAGGLDPMVLMMLMQGDKPLDPVMLMMLQGGDIDPMTLMLMQGGDIDPMTLMLMQGGDIDPLTMMLLSGKDVDPMMLMLLNKDDGAIDPLTLMLLTKDGAELDPMMLMLLTKGDDPIDPIMLMALTGADIDPVMLMMMGNGGNDDMLMMMVLSQMQAAAAAPDADVAEE